MGDTNGRVEACTMNSDIVNVLLSAINDKNADTRIAIDGLRDAIEDIRKTIVGSAACKEHREDFVRRMGLVEDIVREYDLTKDKLLTKEEAINMFSSKEDIKRIMDKLECMDRKLVLMTNIGKLLKSAAGSKYATFLAMAFLGMMLFIFNVLYEPITNIINLIR